MTISSVARPVFVLGQSNALRLQYYGGDDASGLTRLRDTLLTQDPAAAFRFANYAVGSSGVDGDNYYQPARTADAIWWYPDTQTPGPALLNAILGMTAELATQPLPSEPVTILWAQGETEAEMLRRGITDIERYKQATIDIFRMIETTLGVDAEFYLVQTGRFDIPEGEDPARFARKTATHEMIQQAQADLADQHADIHLAAVTKSLAMQDTLHYTLDASELLGAQIGNYLAGAFSGTGGNDRMEGTDGDDVLEGGDGKDRLAGLEGHDYLAGGTGTDTIEGGGGDDTLAGGDNSDQLHGGEGRDYILAGAGNDLVEGGTEDDTVHGGNGNDRLHGEAGDDRLHGEAHDDALCGDAGRDTLDGGTGDDTLTGGADADLLSGGAGSDIFQFLSADDSTAAARDRMLDFTPGEDRFDVSALGIDGIRGMGLPGLHELRITYSLATDRTYVLDDATGFQFYLEGDLRGILSEGDFLFA